MDSTLFPFIFPKFPSPDDDGSAAAGGLTRAELAAVVIIAVVLIVGIIGLVACCVLRRKNIAVRIGNDIHTIATGTPAAAVNDA